MLRLSRLALCTAVACFGLTPILSSAAAPVPQVSKRADGQFDVRYGRTVVTGLAFAPGDQVLARIQTVNAQGAKALVITNAQNRASMKGVRTPGDAGSMGTGSGKVPTVYTLKVPREGLPSRVNVRDDDVQPLGTDRMVDRLGDLDNFGYGRGTGTPPCSFYDLRDADDLGVFDHEDSGPSDAVESWAHHFELSGTPSLVRFATMEMFSDGTSSTISMDGITMTFAVDPFAKCGIARRVFVLTGSDAAIAADGHVDMVFTENGDDIVLDRSRLTVITDSAD